MSHIVIDLLEHRPANIRYSVRSRPSTWSATVVRGPFLANIIFTSYYEDIMYARLAHIKANAGNTLMITTDGAPEGVDSVMWCIRTWAMVKVISLLLEKTTNLKQDGDATLVNAAWPSSGPSPSVRPCTAGETTGNSADHYDSSANSESHSPSSSPVSPWPSFRSSSCKILTSGSTSS